MRRGGADYGFGAAGRAMAGNTAESDLETATDVMMSVILPIHPDHAGQQFTNRAPAGCSQDLDDIPRLVGVSTHRQAYPRGTCIVYPRESTNAVRTCRPNTYARTHSHGYTHVTSPLPVTLHDESPC